MQYITNRKRATDYIKRLVSNYDFQAEEKYFINSICIDLGVKKTLVKEILEIFIENDIIYREGGNIINKKKYKKTSIDIEMEDEFKKAGLG